MDDVIGIAKHFCNIDLIKEVEPIGTGHINRTYRLHMSEGDDIILQQINNNVFNDVEGLSNNVEVVLNLLSYITDKYPKYIRTLSGDGFVKVSGDYWRAITSVPDSKVYINLNGNSKRAFSCGTTLGEFHNMLGSVSVDMFKDILPQFHSAERRYCEFHDALKSANKERLKSASVFIDYAINFEESIMAYSNDIFSDNIPLRIVHNDPKLSNILFNNNDEAICLIDYDTVMAGTIITDFGDALRTVAAQTNEDEERTDRIKFDMNLYRQFTRGYLSEIKDTITTEEKNKLYYAPLYITFIMGLRFLTDYLNNDIYYNTAYAEHNLVRAINQFTLVNDIKGKLKDIESVIISDV